MIVLNVVEIHREMLSGVIGYCLRLAAFHLATGAITGETPMLETGNPIFLGAVATNVIHCFEEFGNQVWKRSAHIDKWYSGVENAVNK